MKMKTTLEKPMVNDPMLELIEYSKTILSSLDVLRSVVLFSLSCFSVLNMAFVTNFWYEAHLGGITVDVYHMLFCSELTLLIFFVSLLTTFPLLELTWNHAKMDLIPLLTDILDRLIFLFCVYLSLGYVLTVSGLFGEVLPAVLFYGVSFLLIHRLGQIQIAKREVLQIQRAYERQRRQSSKVCEGVENQGGGVG
ncbi:hypothetical protein E4H12_14150 [Candidatus Thorarchaeota archaeon]|nr:MAG: hypothetical protein E4H12_14150 [Candidatus Thorarchaeota archaeon]